MDRKAYPSDVSDDEWAFVAPYLTLMTEAAPQRDYPLREVFNALRWLARSGAQWRMLPNDLPPWSAVYQQTQRWLKAGVFESLVHDLRMLLREIAVDTLGHLLALLVTPANEQDRAQVAALAEQVQVVTGETVAVAFVDQGYTGEQAAKAAEAHGMRLEVVKLPTSKRGFVLLPRRWVVERSFAWTTRFRRLARDYERLPETLAGLHFLAFAIVLLKRFVTFMVEST
jgi:transposase